LNEDVKAIKAYVKTLRILRLQFGESNEEVAMVQFKLGSIYMKQGDVLKATKCYDDSIKIKTELAAATKKAKKSQNSSKRNTLM